MGKSASASSFTAYVFISGSGCLCVMCSVVIIVELPGDGGEV